MATAVANGITTLLPSILHHCAGACWLMFLPVKLLLFAVLLLGVAVDLAIAISHTAG